MNFMNCLDSIQLALSVCSLKSDLFCVYAQFPPESRILLETLPQLSLVAILEAQNLPVCILFCLVL